MAALTSSEHNVTDAAWQWPPVFHNVTALYEMSAWRPLPVSLPWLGGHDRCVSGSAAARRDGPAPRRNQIPRALLERSMPRCGGIAFYHLPKTGGSTVECFLGAQRQHACCYRGTCGRCRYWSKARGRPQCQHRDLISPRIWARLSTVSGLARRFLLPDDLFRVRNLSTVMRNGFRFVASYHLGPVDGVPGMNTAQTSVLRYAYLRDRVFGSLGCRLVVATFLRHPVAQLLSAWRYTRGNPEMSGRDLAQVAMDHREVMLGIDSRLYRTRFNGLFGPTVGDIPVGTLGRADTGGDFEAYASQQASSMAAHVLEPLLHLFDVVGHLERFDESLLLLIDAAGLQAPYACPAHVNRNAECDSSPQRCKNATEWALVARLMPELVHWYELRLARFDDATRARGKRFATRVRLLRQGRNDLAHKLRHEEHRRRYLDAES